MDNKLVFVIFLIMVAVLLYIYKLKEENKIQNSTSKSLSKLYKNAKVVPYNNQSKFVIMSDCHRGVGNASDNFLKNQHLFFAALSDYYKKGFTYIELGDGDELWENRSMEKIIEIHSNSLWLMSKFYRENRLYMIYGNHDIQKKNKKFVEDNLSKYFCESSKEICPLFPGLEVYEGLILENKDNKNQRIFLAHGHQGDLINDKLAKLGGFLVRYVWRTLEIWGANDPTGAGTNFKKRNKVERRLIKWVKEENKLLIAGHTHRPVFPSIGEVSYFNDGSCVHPRCITALEIKEGTICLVKWTVMTRKDRTMYVERVVLEGPERLEDYFK